MDTTKQLYYWLLNKTRNLGYVWSGNKEAELSVLYGPTYNSIYSF